MTKALNRTRGTRWLQRSILIVLIGKSNKSIFRQGDFLHGCSHQLDVLLYTVVYLTYYTHQCRHDTRRQRLKSDSDHHVLLLTNPEWNGSRYEVREMPWALQSLR